MLYNFYIGKIRLPNLDLLKLLIPEFMLLDSQERGLVQKWVRF